MCLLLQGDHGCPPCVLLQRPGAALYPHRVVVNSLGDGEPIAPGPGSVKRSFAPHAARRAGWPSALAASARRARSGGKRSVLACMAIGYRRCTIRSGCVLVNTLPATDPARMEVGLRRWQCDCPRARPGAHESAGQPVRSTASFAAASVRCLETKDDEIRMGKRRRGRQSVPPARPRRWLARPHDAPELTPGRSRG